MTPKHYISGEEVDLDAERKEAERVANEERAYQASHPEFGPIFRPPDSDDTYDHYDPADEQIRHMEDLEEQERCWGEKR